MPNDTLTINEDYIREQLNIAMACKSGKMWIDKICNERLLDISDKFKDDYLELWLCIARLRRNLSEFGDYYLYDMTLSWIMDDGIIHLAMRGHGMILHELVGDLSESLLFCSYNDDQIREMWVNGTINERLKECESIDRTSLHEYIPADGDIRSLMTFLLKQEKYWPGDYQRAKLFGPTNLTAEELKILEDFDSIAYIKQQQT
jgi:hypothetical protein